VPFSVRVSATIFTAPRCSSIVITGSTFDSASIWPDSIAAIAALPVPTPMYETSEAFMPCFDRK